MSHVPMSKINILLQIRRPLLSKGHTYYIKFHNFPLAKSVADCITPDKVCFKRTLFKPLLCKYTKISQHTHPFHRLHATELVAVATCWHFSPVKSRRTLGTTKTICLYLKDYMSLPQRPYVFALKTVCLLKHHPSHRFTGVKR